jgi:hypothetical protein
MILYACVKMGQSVMEVIAMNRTPPGREPPSFGIGKLLFAIVLAIVVLLLVQSMVRHRFFQGGRDHRNGSIGQ